MESKPPYILAIDQGTTSTRAIVFNSHGEPLASASEPLEQIYPHAGWVEHDAQSIWQATLKVCRQVLDDQVLGEVEGDVVAAIGITNQRETTLLWDRKSGQPVHNAIVWQDRRTADLCEVLRTEGLEDHISATTGLLLDPYFSATKLNWLLSQSDEWQRKAEAGELAFGTIDSWLIYKLTGGRVHATDATNASRTMLFNIHKGDWDTALLERLSIPRACLPQVRDCQADFGVTDPQLFGREIPILGVAGDQQAAAFGQACFEPGMIKATYGTGCFAVANTGTKPVQSKNRMLATILHQTDGERTYALEGSIFMAGATIQWLRDSLGLFKDASETEALARAADPNSGVYLVPAFQGLGAPYWDAQARGAILGLSRAASKAEIVRAGLESVAFQTRDLISAMTADMTAAGLAPPTRLRVDGGMTANDWLMQFLADCLAMDVEVAAIAQTTALGAAFHAGLKAGIFKNTRELSAIWRARKTYSPQMSRQEADSRYEGWQHAVARIRSAS